jgi:hypothetical protein
MKNGVFWDVTPVALVRPTLLITANVVPSSPILVTLMMEALSSPKRPFLQEPHGVTSQKTPFFIVTAVNTSNLSPSILTYTLEDSFMA